MLREPAGLSLPAGSAVGSCYRWWWHPEIHPSNLPPLGSPEASPPLYPVLIWKQMEGGATNLPPPPPQALAGSFLLGAFVLSVLMLELG